MATSKKELFKRRKSRTRHQLKTVSTGRPRLSIFRSNKNISVQVIDDSKGVTLASASTLEKDLGIDKGYNMAAAEKIGAAIAERALKAGIDKCYFDRGGYMYHGRVKALADSARTNGLQI
ncbi:MAG: 50S ribosomal protein L18 [Rhodobacteraceae bacterium]|nr:50S ribosomal protein L18 [Paracoccaceae bacterium]